jgi:hypothetical protein
MNQHLGIDIPLHRLYVRSVSIFIYVYLLIVQHSGLIIFRYARQPKFHKQHSYKNTIRKISIDVAMLLVPVGEKYRYDPTMCGINYLNLRVAIPILYYRIDTSSLQINNTCRRSAKKYKNALHVCKFLKTAYLGKSCQFIDYSNYPPQLSA